MPTSTHVTASSGDHLVLVGTMKGAFVLRADGSRSHWDAGGPYFPGRAVYALMYDGRQGRHRLWAAVNSPFWGSYLSSSDDFGRTWSEPETYGIRFPEGSDTALKQIWQIVPGGADQPDTIYCGVEPAALFRSDDAGATWSLVSGLFDHPHRSKWMPGAGGLCLHTILPAADDSRRVHIAISSAGHYRTDDGGLTWQARNGGVRAQFLPEGQRYPEFGQCVHKMVTHPSRPDRLFLQNHWGLYRSDDRGDSWQDIANGVPSDFGFAMAMDPTTRTPSTSSRSSRTCSGARPREAARLPDARRRRVVGAIDRRAAAGAGARDDPARRHVHGHGLADGRVLRHAQHRVSGRPTPATRGPRCADGLPPVVCVKTARV
ncbi:MAG: hypothetical protein R2752_03375 [Vicinamibacterales bacterium]